MTVSPDDRADELPDQGALLDLVGQLDDDNERLRSKVLELMRLMEDAVTAQVAGERHIAELEAHVERVEAELDAIHRTRVMRITRPVRSWYGRVLARVRAGR